VIHFSKFSAQPSLTHLSPLRLRLRLDRRGLGLRFLATGLLLRLALRPRFGGGDRDFRLGGGDRERDGDRRRLRGGERDRERDRERRRSRSRPRSEPRPRSSRRSRRSLPRPRSRSSPLISPGPSWRRIWSGVLRFSLAKTTVICRPSRVDPSISYFASSAIFASKNSTNPKPLGSLV